MNANPYAYLDDAPLEERRARAVEMRRILPESVLSEVGRLDPAAIAEVCADAWPDVRDADELHDALTSFIAFPEPPPQPETNAEYFADTHEEDRLRASWRQSLFAWTGFFDQLVSGRRAARAVNEGRTYWVAAEKAKTFLQTFPAARFDAQLPEVETSAPMRDDALLALVAGWMTHAGPVTAHALSDLVGLPAPEIEKVLLRLEASGMVLRGRFTGPSAETTEWCERRLLARIHRLTLGKLRKEIQPVTAAQFMRWLLRWQHVAPGSQLLGEHGTLEAVRQLQGFEAPANSWERQILARRIANYDPAVLDQLCLTGTIGWGRLSPHPATLEDASEAGRRVVPTSVAPIAFFVREDADWMIPQRAESSDEEMRGLSRIARDVLEFLKQRGASFFADIVRGAGKLKAEVETALWELVAAGLITADGFDNLRALIDPKRRAGHGSGRSARPRHSSGRWSLLYPAQAVDRARAVEATSWMLLRRYGVVFRELLGRESILPRWRELLIALRRLEDRGEVRGGRFVSGFLGEQFALPVAVESVRATRDLAPSGEVVTLSAADPLNLVGILLPGERVPAISGRFVAYCDRVPIPAEERITRITTLAAAR